MVTTVGLYVFAADEINDGLASCAREQALAWAQEAEELSKQGNTQNLPIDKKFIESLIRLANEEQHKRLMEDIRNGNNRHNDAVSFHNGVFSSTRRLQVSIK
jgi:hypothetical protein